MWNLKETKNENSLLDYLHLSNGQLTAKIYPNLGGSLQQLSFKTVDVIDGINSDEMGLEEYRNTFKSSILFPFPNRVKDGKYAYGEHTYELSINDLHFNNAIHGLVHDRSFTWEIVENDSDKILLQLTYSADGSDAGFPFAYDLKLLYTFDRSGAFELRFEVINSGYQTFPFGIGWHPYFLSRDLGESRVSAKFKDHFICPERMIPEEKEEAQLEGQFRIGEQAFDDGFSLYEPNCILDTPDYRLRMRFDTGSESYLQIYTPEHRQSIALEPMTCVTDALNNGVGLEALDPGESYQWSIEMKVILNKEAGI
jgi:aldose 1-epimerase